MRNLILGVSVGLVALSVPGGRTEASTPDRSNARASLFAQSAGEALARDFPTDQISYLLLDAHTGKVLASHWDHPEEPIPLGSLVKPFAALAYGEQHAFRYPTHTCYGTSTGCWFPRGHGHIDLTSAVAQSCNSYFRALTADLTPAQVAPIAVTFGLQPPSSDLPHSALTGLGNRWKIAPLNMARAYVELLRRRDQPGVRQILAGMAESAQQGTGAEVDRSLPYPDALVKTGTAACTHKAPAPGDGFIVALTPAAHPQVLLMVRAHGVPGAQAAKVAGQMLRRIEP
jgi:cell division protein FtsI/penicillin-binding protein 2